MKKIICFLSIVFFCLNLTFAQNKLSETEKLAATSKVWGFLKYYHPQVADGKYNWDKQLFDVLPKVKNASDKEQLSQVFIEWIESLGKVKKCNKCDKKQSNKYFDKNFNLDWFYDRNVFTSKLSQTLKSIEINRHQGKKYYVSSNGRIGNIIIKNEVSYKDFNWKNENLRLLSLFRYWNIIEYFFPYKYQTDIKWNEVLNQMIPKFINPKTEIDFHLAMLELIVSIDDSHAKFGTKQTNSFFGYKWIPAKFELINDKAIITGFYNDSLAKLDDLKIGDVITKVNEMHIKTIFSDKEKYISGSNQVRKKVNALYAIFNGSTDSVKIEFSRNNKNRVKIIKRYLFNDFNDTLQLKKEKYKILSDNIGYVNMGEIKIKDVSKIMDSLINMKAIIFDIRSYPNGTLNVITNYISSKKNDFYNVTFSDLDYPGKFIIRSGRQSGHNQELKYKGKVILLVNEKSQSQAEFTAMGLQTGNNVTTIGSQTSGADGNISIIEMVGGFKTAISGIGIFYPDGTETQRKGVKIDIEVRPTLQGMIQGKDEVLEKAIVFANE